jgi:hypothetical protein
MDPCAGWWRLWSVWTISRPGCVWSIVILLKWSGDSGIRWLSSIMLVRFRRRGTTEVHVTSNQRQIWKSVRPI